MLRIEFGGASGYGNSTYGTWEISMQEIEKRARGPPGKQSLAAQSAIILHQCFAFLHNDNISEDIFKNAASNYTRRDIQKEKKKGMPLSITLLDPKFLLLSEDRTWDKLQFREGIKALLSFSLIESHNKLYSVHPLVHAWSRERILKSEISYFYYKVRALLSCSVHPSYEEDNYAFCAQLVPHMRASQVYATQLKLNVG